MTTPTLIAALAEVRKICSERERCEGCPFELPHGCRARVPDEDMDDWPSNWPGGETSELRRNADHQHRSLA